LGLPGVVRFFGPYCYRCDFGLEYPSCGLRCADALEQQVVMEGPETVAAIILEPFTAAAGGYPAPGGYLRRVRDICDTHGLLMIADEVICGFGRTGEWFAVDHDRVAPDILTVAKGITSGYVPMGAAIVGEKVAAHFEDHLLPIGCTYTAHPLACAAALAALDEYEHAGVIENGRAMGLVLADGLADLQERHRCIGDLRSRGLFACLELVRDRETRERLVPFNSNSPFVAQLKQHCLDRGLFVFPRWNLVLLAPPLTIGEDELRNGIGILDEVLRWVEEQM